MDSVIDGKGVSGAMVNAKAAQTVRSVTLPWKLADGEADTATQAAAPQGQVRRVALLTAAGAAAFALAYAFAPRESEVAVVEASDAVRPRATSAPPRASEQVPVLKRTVRADIALSATSDPFVGASFVPPPPPAVVPPPPPPPPAPKAPPLPFAFVGLLEQGAGKPAAFLARGDALLVVSVGDIIESDYRVESLSPTDVVLIYLPLDERQRLSVTGAKP
jgi:hypothetical protein